MTVYFRLRTGQRSSEKPRQLYIRLKVDGVECSDYASGVYVRPDKWNSSQQKVVGYSKLAQETNNELESILAEHKSLLAELMRLHNAGVIPLLPAAETIKQHWTRKATLIPTLLDAFQTHYTYLRSLKGTPEAREERTLSKWKNGMDYLAEYVKLSKSERLTCDLISNKWAEGFYHYLIKKPLGLATAARYTGYLRASLNHLVEIQQLAQNPIANYFPDKGKDKPIYFLEDEHLDKLWQVETPTESHGLARDWLLLLCYTGMDQPDLERYVASPGNFTEETEAGPMIVIPRGKTGLIACIPLLPEVGRVLANYPGGIPKMSNQEINRWTTIIQDQIGFTERLTVKICRKTAGALFLRKGYRIEEVSKVLGHSSIQTTLRNYVRVTGAMVRAGMLRVQGASQSTPFIQIHKTA
ncbi:tyrosine-type recombinase/integrase [Spirosoma validum]|uniref:Phage integrase SAM-like domain-containing protein n=1 Tax=Spirosoma validum TaxID=2771355 RepID=A0A927AYG8_9BACT|nr:phage integrase SAM-like domain-containing protein [Spirosoma validum]MBD2752007.1 phage integrase SAM-like domain-containing protein [Spirosoma validum]